MQTLTPQERKKLEAQLWKGKDRDYKSNSEGIKKVLYYDPARGTCLMPLTAFTDEQLIKEVSRNPITEEKKKITYDPNTYRAELSRATLKAVVFEIFGNEIKIKDNDVMATSSSDTDIKKYLGTYDAEDKIFDFAGCTDFIIDTFDKYFSEHKTKEADL